MSQFFVDNGTTINPIPIVDALTFHSFDDGSSTNPVAGTINFSSITGPQIGSPMIINMSGPGTVTFRQQVTTAVPSNGGSSTGLSMFFEGNFAVDSTTGFVTTFAPPNKYTNVTNAMSPYTVAVTDGYISCDTSTGPITLNFPNSLSTGSQGVSALILWDVKDRTGNAGTNNITCTSTGGIVTFDGAVSTVINSNFGTKLITSNLGLSNPYTPAYEIYVKDQAGALGLNVISVTGTSANLVPGNSYILSNAGVVTLTLPTAAPLGSTFMITNTSSQVGGYIIAQNAGQLISSAGTSSTPGVTGNADCTGTGFGVGVIVQCVVANSEWILIADGGNWALT